VSVGFMKGILESEACKAFEGSWIVNDVRDVAAAHILAAENPAAKGRWVPESTNMLGEEKRCCCRASRGSCARACRRFYAC
jgi:nucleoside-diphosphate-sugar epimerase